MLIDISQTTSPASAVFPGDTPFSMRKVAEMKEGASCDVGTIETTLHAGTHSDAPNHFAEGAAGIDGVPLEKYYGPCRVVSRPGPAPITRAEVETWRLQPGMRFLVRTRDTVDPTEWPAEFAHFDEDAAQALAEARVALVGLDTPSMDHQDSKDLPAHKALLSGGVAILENLDLTRAPDGLYELMAFPIKIENADAAPVRAVLRNLM